MDPIYQKLMDYAMRALSRRAHTVQEMREKLKKRPMHTADHENQIIARLKELNLLNDEEYVRRRIENAVNFKRQGLRKVMQRLYPKGIPTKQTQQIWDSMKIDERAVAQAALKKMKSLKDLPKAKRYQKRAQFLASRGFSVEVVFDLAKQDD